MKKFKLGLQLFSVRDALNEDFEGTLKKVKEMGYDYVEFAGYYDRSAEEIKALLDKYGLTAISAHQDYPYFFEGDMQKKIDFLKTLGIKYVAQPWLNPDKRKGGENYEKAITDMKLLADKLKENGIQMLYHNHDFEFEIYDGKFQLEWYLEDLEGKVLPEIDTCWVHYSGYDPKEYILKYKNELPVLHLKDFECANLENKPIFTFSDGKKAEMKKLTREEQGFHFKPIGDDLQNIPDILKSAEVCGTQYLIVEQDLWFEIDQMEAAKKSAEYLNSLDF